MVCRAREAPVGEAECEPVRIAIADDHAVVRSGLRLLLEAEDGFEVVGEAGDVEGAVRRCERDRLDVLLLDLAMPGDSSLAALPQLVERFPGVAVVILTMEDQPAFAREALRRGARGYVLKEAAGDELVRAVRTVARGSTYLTPSLAARLAMDDAAADGGADELTPREAEILRLIALGHTNGEVAEQLFLSVRTVESHRASLQHKLDCHSRAELVRYALERGVLKAAPPAEPSR
jgi:two-component system, NarL family, response regulator NreC